MTEDSTTEFVTQIISRKVRPERQRDYERWVQERLTATISEFPGYQGVTVLRPGDTPNKEYVVIQRRASYQDLMQWAESPERREVLAESEPYTVGAPRYHAKETGLEVWFQLPGEGVVKPPPRYKMALLIWMVIAPLTLGVGFLLGPALKLLPWPAAAYLRAGIVVLLMTYAVMPWARKVLARWLEA